MRSKVIALFLISALVIGILAVPAAAFSTWGSESDWRTLTGIREDQLDIILADIENYGFQYAFLAQNSTLFVLYLSDDPLSLCTQGGGKGIRTPYNNSSVKCYSISNGRIGSQTLRTSPQNTYQYQGVYYYYYFSEGWSVGTSGVGYASSDFDVSAYYNFIPYVTYEANLTGFPWQDQRVLNAYNSWFNGEDFIQVEVSDDIFANYAFVTVHGYDSTFETSFYHTFRFDDFLQKGVDGELFYFKLNPRLIPWENFYLDSLEYVSSGSYGSKTVSLPDLNYGYEPMDPDPLVNEYHYNSTTEIHYQYGDASRYIYSMFSAGLWINYESASVITFCDEQRRCAQPFLYSTIFLPYCLTDLNIDFEEFFIECVNYYDLVVVDVNSTCFDLLYGSGSYSYLENYLYTNPSKDLANWYSNHYSVALPLDFATGADPDPFVWNNVSLCSFYFTTSWFFKQTNYLLGDTGDILTELSSRLFEVDGFADKLLGNMAAWASDQTDFYNVLLPKLTPIISFCNDMTLGDYFNKIVDRLDTIVNNLDVPIDLPIDDDVAAMANAFLEFWTKMFQGASPYATAFASTLQSLVSSDPQVFSLPDDPNNIALPVFPSPSVPLLPTLTPTPVPIGG